MNESSDPVRSSEADSSRQSIDIVRDFFELASSQGGSPDLAELIQCVAPAQRAPLFGSLFATEVQHRRARGETLMCDDYIARFPAYETEIRAAFGEGGATVTQALRQEACDQLNETKEVFRDTKASTTSESQAGDPSCRTPSGVRYRVVRPHAKGGLGEVYVAHDEELNREVALKEILPKHADNPDRRSRFLLEAEVTGSLEHPGIVPVYGLGQHEDGRPYYAMRFIRGTTLREAISQFHRNHPDGDQTADHALELRKLLGRFIDVCNAIDYAHSRGVLHRDLKPGNVMLGKYGETLVVDWGLAKLKGAGEEPPVGQEMTVRPGTTSGSATEFGSAVGTPAYMPPEQAAGQLDQLGPASDVYSLGSTLYHLLAGQPPVTDQDIHSLLRKVQEGDFAPPRQVRKDIPAALQAVCLKAMQTEPSARYASPQQLADDVERWLADEPVSAYSEPLTVRVRRWMRKHHRIVSAIAATVLIGLTCFIVVAGVVSRKNRELATANGQLDKANQDLTVANDDLRVANDAERTAKEEAEAVLDFFRLRVLAAARPQDQEGGLGIEATIRAAMDAAEPSIAESFADQPLAEASIRSTVGTTYFYLGENELAVTQHKRALDLREAELGPNHEQTLIAMNDLALSHKYAGDAEQAFKLYQQILESTKVTLGDNHPDTLTYTNNLGEALRAAGRLDRALPMLKETFRRRKKTLGVDHPHTLSTMNNLAMAIEDAGNRDEAILMFEETLQRRRKELGPEHPHTLQSMNNLAAAYLAAGKPSQARELHHSVLELTKAKLGPEHPETLRFMNNLARATGAEGEMDQCLALHTKTLDLRRKRLSSDHPEIFQSVYNVANTYFVMEQPDKAMSLLEQYVAERQSDSTQDDPRLVEVQYRVGDLLLRYEQYPAAETHLRDCLALCEKHPPDDWLMLAAKNMLGATLARQSKFEEAQPLLTESYEGLRKLESSRPIVARTLLSDNLQRIVDMFTDWDKPEEAAKWQSRLDEHRGQMEQSK